MSDGVTCHDEMDDCSYGIGDRIDRYPIWNFDLPLAVSKLKQTGRPHAFVQPSCTGS